MAKRKVLVVTAIRSEYDILSTIIQALERHPLTEPGVVVTGAHLSPLYGYTVREIIADGFPIVGRIESLLNSDSSAGRIKSAAVQLSGLVDLFVQQQPAFVIAPMDREEAITVALAGAYMRIPVVHFGGGDTAEDANIDNAVRHAVTKLAHLHMVSSTRSAERVIRLGEEPWRVHVVGEPGLDRFLSTPEISSEDLWAGLGTEPVSGPFAVLIQHSILSEADCGVPHMRVTLDALLHTGLRVFVSYPNSDSGSQQIIDIIEKYASQYPRVFHLYRNLPRTIFVNLLRRASVLVGNSSAGIIEAPLLRLPAVNVGPRQRGREHSENVIFVEPELETIESAVHKAVFDKKFREIVSNCSNPYGDGHSGERIAGILAEHPIDDRLLNKINTF